MWVVCRKCERWNLTPVEERWEAIEECERVFSTTRLRVSTDQIGLARSKEGLVLVRIGSPQRPEFAAWRYGDQFGRRRKRAIIWGVAGVAAIGGVTAGLAAAGVGIGFAPQIPNIILNARTVAKVRTGDGRLIKIRAAGVRSTQLEIGSRPEDWRIQVKHAGGKEVFYGPEARKVAGQILPALNSTGATKKSVQRAVAEIERAGHPERFLEETQQRLGRFSASPMSMLIRTPPSQLSKLPKPTRLALEMALHEEQERRALEGELMLLEEAWKEAEEIAHIADNMFVPDEINEFIARHKTAT